MAAKARARVARSSCCGGAQVCYYRYLRFLPGGQFLYRTSPQPLREVARSLLRSPPARGRAADEVMQRGRFLLRVCALSSATRVRHGWVLRLAQLAMPLRSVAIVLSCVLLSTACACASSACRITGSCHLWRSGGSPL